MIADLVHFIRLWRNLSLTPGALRRLQERKLRALLHHAYENVPYYRDVFGSAGVHPDDIRSLADLPRVPMTTKRDLLAAGADRITRRGFDLAADTPIRTAGSTGEPFAIYLDGRERRQRRLIEFRGLVRLGLKPSDRLVVLGNTRAHKTRPYQRLGLYRSQNITVDVPVEEQIRRLERLQPTVLWAYPTALRAVMHRLDDQLHRIIQPRFVISSAEVLDPTLRARISGDLGAETFDLYAAMEVGRVAWECRAHRGMHVNADSVILESVGGDRPGAADRDRVVVVTALDGYTMPMIRYRLGDLATFAEGACPCGVSLPRIEPPLGRENAMLVLPSGRAMSPMVMNVLVRGLGMKLERWRLTQHALDHLSLSIVPATEIDPRDLEELRRSVLDFLGEAVRFEIRVAEQIPDSRVKFSAFVSELAS
jgi:phenylacetate-CoA ligase